MGLTAGCTGIKATDIKISVQKNNPDERVIALAGNPNVGKSTVFNALTGLNQHTGNWPGKTVATAFGNCRCKNAECIFADLPGTYSLCAHSGEEEVARDFIYFGNRDAVVVVCDATCLERNLNLLLQILEVTPKTVLCLNLIDEAKKKNISVDSKKLSNTLGIPVIPVCARNKTGFDKLKDAICTVSDDGYSGDVFVPKYTSLIENAINILIPETEKIAALAQLSPRLIARKLLEKDENFKSSLLNIPDLQNIDTSGLFAKITEAENYLNENGISLQNLRDAVSSRLIITAEGIAAECVCGENLNYSHRDRKIDKILTGKFTGIPVMLLMLGIIFWITIVGANYPSQLLSDLLFSWESHIYNALLFMHLPPIICEMLTHGVYRVVAWVVSVMLPPMAIFFPLFTLLEDLGYLPRVAFNLDNVFKKCGTCGKQSLTM